MFGNILDFVASIYTVIRCRLHRIFCGLFSVGSKEKVDALTVELKTAGYEVISGPRTTGDGYYESCIVAIEGNQIEVTV